MAGEIIRKGDKTSHGGTVLEGSLSNICMGKPIAYVGHMTQCPKCKGNYPIAEGAMSTTFYGKGVALAGMRTSCGAVLIAGQFSDIVEWGTGASTAAVGGSNYAGTASTEQLVPHDAVEQTASENDKDIEIEIEHFYSLLDQDGEPIESYSYDLHIADELHIQAGNYNSGETVTIKGKEPTRLVTWLHKDGVARV